MNQHLLAVAQVSALVVCLAVSALGWGRVAANLLRIEGPLARRPISLLWLGWSLTLLLLHLIHFFLPLTAATVTPLYLAGVPFALLAIRERQVEIRRGVRRPAWMGAAAAAGLTILVVWVASRAMAPPGAYDYGLYRHNTMQWINSYRIVPGLGNLHPRLAFNQSPLLYFASLNLYPSFGQGRVVGLTFLTVLLVAALVSVVLAGPSESRRTQRGSSHEFHGALFLLPLTAYIAVAWQEFSSGAPDLVAMLLQLWIYLVLCHAIDRWNEGLDASGEFRALAFLAATAITVKLSNLAFSAAIIGMAFFHSLGPERRLRRVASDLWLPCLVLLAWSIRGILLSGMPFFPSPVGRLPVDWAMPRDVAVDTANWIRGWARLPGADPQEVLGRWEWFRPWMESMRWKVVELVGPLAELTLAATCLGLLSLRRARPWHWRDGLILLPPLGGVVFWFWMAPEPRFLGAQLWLLLVGVAALLAQMRYRLAPRASMAVILGTLALLVVPFVVQLRKYPWMIHIRTDGEAQNLSVSGFHAVPQVRLRAVRNSQGVRYFVPRAGDQCWDAPLPCTWSRDEKFLLRDRESLGAGFRAQVVERP